MSGQGVFANPDDEGLRRLLAKTRHIAVVGLSSNAGRPSYGVARAMQSFGYRITPVNPVVDQVLGEPAVPALADLGAPVDLVNVFRDPVHVPALVEQCLALELPALWLQESVVDQASAARARAAGMTVVMDRCIYKEYRRLAPIRR